MGVSTFLVGCLPTYEPGRHARAGPPRDPAPAPGPLGRRRAGRRQLDVVRARARRPSRLLHQLHPQRHPGRPGAGPGRVPAARRRAARRPAAVLGLAGPVLDQRDRRARRLPDPPHASTRPRSSRPRPRAARSPRAPLGVLFADHWRGVLRVFLAAFIAMVNTMFQIFALNFATSDDYEIGFSDTFMLWLAIVANLVAISVIPFWARLSDRVGRKQVFVTGVVGSGILIWGFLGAIAAGNEPLTFVLGVAAGRRRLQHAERGLARDVRRVLPDPRPPVRHGDRHPVRLRAGRLHARPSPARSWAATRTTGSRSRSSPSAACAISAIAVLTGPSRTHLVPTPEVGAPPRRAANRRRPWVSREHADRTQTSYIARARRRRHRRLAHPGHAGAGGPRERPRRQLPDHRRRGARPRGRRPAGDPGLGRAAGVRRAQHHPPLQAGRGAAARRAVRGRRGPRCGQHGRCSATAAGSAATPTGPATAGRSAQVLPDAVEDRVVLVGAGGAGVAVGYALLHQGAEHVAVVDADRERADACVVRLAKRFGDDRVGVATDLAGRAGRRPGARERDAGGHERPRRDVGPGRPAARATCGSATSSTSRSRPS